MKYFFSIVSLLHVLNTSAQDEIPTYYGAAIVPPSPTSASLGKYGDVPVSLYTGVPQISIPFYEVKEGNLSLPISLSYHSQGFKVDDIPSWVGLGWSLNAGGTITRAVKGVPDDLSSGFGTDPDWGWGSPVGGGYLSSGNIIEDMYNSNLTSTNSMNYIYYLAYNGLDGEPDIFYFNFPGASGQFVFDKNGNINILSQQNLKINCTRTPSNGPITKFEIVDGNGNIYTFDEVEKTRTIGYNFNEDDNPFFVNQEGFTDYISNPSDPFFHPEFNSSWHLTKIKNATKNHEINLSYSLENQQYLSGFSTQYRNWDLVTHSPKIDWSWQTLSISAKRLSEISWTQGSIVFNATVDREDLNGINFWPSGASGYDGYQNYAVPSGEAKALASIEIKNNINSLIKKYNFNYSYFLANSSGAGSNISMYKKLKLLSVTEQNSDLSATNPPYLFEYDETVPIAPRYSMRQDFWGYLKATAAPGKVYNPLTYFYPNDPIDNDFLSTFSYFHRTSNNSSEVILGSYNKSTETAASKSCIIKKIIYPTKGTTSFEFEPHEFILQNSNKIGGGLRIKTITDYDGSNHTNDIIKNYIYTQSTNPTLSSGKVLTLPVFAKQSTCSYSGAPDGKIICLFNNSIALLGSTMGSFVGYSEVTVEYNGNGKIISKFHLPATVGVEQEDCDVSGNNCIYKRTKSILTWGTHGGCCDACIKDNFPYADNPNYDWNRGSLLEELVYDNQNRLLQKSVNEYVIKNYNKIPAITSSLLFKTARTTPPWNASDFWFRFKNALHYYISGWKVLSKQTVTKYDVNNASSLLTTSSNYFYDNPTHKQITKSSFIDSKGIINETILKRSTDFSPSTLFLSSLISQNRVNEVIESQTWINDGNRKLLGAKFTEYKDFASENGNTNPQILPYKTYNLETSTIIPEANFSPTTFNASSFILDSRFKILKENKYDNKDNYQSQSIYAGGLKNNSTHIFGHNKGLIIAKINNASETDCSFTSFESDDYLVFGNYAANIQNDGHCGTKSYLLPANTFGPGKDYMPSAETQNKKFIFSCWVKTNSNVAGNIGSLVLYTNQSIGSGAIYPNVTGAYVATPIYNTNNVWKYIEIEIDPKAIKIAAGLPLSTNLGIRSFVWNTGTTVGIQIDDMRFYPKEARMATYTYNTLIGVSSISDENSNCQYYEYDTFGRLKIVKDQNGKILEKTDYNYKP